MRPNKLKTRIPPDKEPAARRAPLRVGLIGGLVLAVAMSALVMAMTAQDEQGSSLGVMLMTAGMAAVGLFSARESKVTTRRSASKNGLLAGLIAGVFVTLAFVGTMLLTSFSPENIATWQAQVTAQASPQQMEQFQSSGIPMDQLVRISLGLMITICAVGLPVIGAVLGLMGGATAPLDIPED
jgi:hypothetical protein